jgi:hypothetical protein
MADDQDVVNVEENIQAEEPADVDEDLFAHSEWGWIGPEPRKIASEITPTSLGVYTIIEEDPEPGNERHFAVYNVGPYQWICSTFHRDGFGMYEFVFKELKLKLPFSPLALDIFDWCRLAPSQLHPNSMAFVIAFERLCEYKNIVPTRPLFFRVFKIQRTTNGLGQRSWVSFKQRVSLFDMYVESVRGFKSRFFVVQPKTRLGRETLYKWVEDKNEDGTVKKNEDGSDKMKEVEKFPLSWTDEHFKKGTDKFPQVVQLLPTW